MNGYNDSYGDSLMTSPKSSAPAPSVAPTASSAEKSPPIVAALDMGASAIRLVVAELRPGEQPRVLEQASRGVLLGKDTFTHGRIGPATLEATLKVLEGFRRIMDTYGVARYRAIATSAVREAANRDVFLDRVRLRTGLDVEVVDGSEENRLTYVAVRAVLAGHDAMTAGTSLLAEVGGGSADLSFLRNGEPVHSGTYPLGAIRLRQSLASWHGSHEHRVRLLRRHVHNIVEDIAREIPLAEARHLIALGGDVRFLAARLNPDAGDVAVHTVTRQAFLDLLRRDVKARGRRPSRKRASAVGPGGDAGSGAARLSASSRARPRPSRSRSRTHRCGRGCSSTLRGRKPATESRTLAGRCW